MAKKYKSLKAVGKSLKLEKIEEALKKARDWSPKFLRTGKR
jgi:hypothetical protein